MLGSLLVSADSVQDTCLQYSVALLFLFQYSIRLLQELLLVVFDTKFEEFQRLVLGWPFSSLIKI